MAGLTVRKIVAQARQSVFAFSIRIASNFAKVRHEAPDLWLLLRAITRAGVVEILYWLTLLPALLIRAPANPQGPTYLPTQPAADKVGVFVTAMDTWVNQLIALALALFLLISWLFRSVVLSQERRNWLDADALILLLALVLTLWSITAGMELKWRGFILTGSVLLNVPAFAPSTPANFLADKAFMQARLLIYALALTLTCLPALWHRRRDNRAGE